MNYLVSFYYDCEEDINSATYVAIRGKLEDLSPQTWIQVFPNLLLIQSDLDIKDIYSEVDSVSQNKRFIVTEITNPKVNELRSDMLITKLGY